jgi:hypothetical protein
MAENLGGPRREDVEALTLGYLVVFPFFPTASKEHRGRVAIKFNAAGVADEVKVCHKKADDSYEWVDVTTAIQQSVFDAKFHETTGHKHTGAAGDGPLLDEYGSNANGEYVKHANGVLECWGTTAVTIPAGSSGVYGPDLTYPVPFVGEEPAVVFGNKGNSASVSNIGVETPTVGTLLTAFRPYVKQADTVARTHNVYWRAIGRWK